MTGCLFCKIAAHEIAVAAVFEDDDCLVFPDLHPQAPVHLLVIPKAHTANAAETGDRLLGKLLLTAARMGAEKLPAGYRIVTNTGADAGQSVGHLHLHLLGGRSLGWPPG